MISSITIRMIGLGYATDAAVSPKTDIVSFRLVNGFPFLGYGKTALQDGRGVRMTTLEKLVLWLDVLATIAIVVLIVQVFA